MTTLAWGPQLTGAIGATYAACASGRTLLLAYVTGGVVNVVRSTDQGYAFGSAISVGDTIAGEVMLNESFVRDQITGRLHLFWQRHQDNPSNPPQLVTAHSDDDGVTWSAITVVDDGTGRANNRFYRVGAAAYDGVVGVAYTSYDNGVFDSDGLWFLGSTDGGVTYAATTQKFAATVVHVGEPNAAIGEDGAMHVSWYDGGVNTNVGGDIYYARCDWDAAGFQWPAASTRVTTGETCGRTRVDASHGVVMCITNTNWGGSVADVATVRSTDNGDTWGAVVTQATHSAGALDHPWLNLDDQYGVMLWVDHGTSPDTYGAKISSDAGATWTTMPNAPLTTTGSSDAPRLVTSDDLMWAFGYDNVAGQNIRRCIPLFSPDPAQAAVQDDFNRANEDPLSGGGNWHNGDTFVSTASSAKLVTNQVQRRNGAGSFDRAGNYRTDVAFTTAADFRITLKGTSGGDAQWWPYLGNPATRQGYSVDQSSAATPYLDIGRRNGGTRTTLISTSGAPNPADGDELNLRITPNDVVALRYDVGMDAWYEALRNPDTTYRTTMRPGFSIAGVASVTAIDDAAWGVLDAPSNTVAPVASGSVSNGSVLSVTSGTWATANGATPARYTYQWQTSPAGAGTWSDVARATLPFFTVVDGSLDHRCVVTAINSIGTATANSNALVPGYTLSANPGTYAIVGAAAAPVAGRLVAAAAGTYAVTGDAAALLVARLLAAAPGAYAVTGAAAALLAGRVVPAGPGAYLLTGAAADLSVLSPTYVLAAAPGSYAITGDPGTVTVARILPAAPGDYVVTGDGAALQVGHQLAALAGTYDLVGGAALLRAARALTAAAGAYAVTGSAAQLAPSVTPAPMAIDAASGTLPVGEHPSATLVRGDSV